MPNPEIKLPAWFGNRAVLQADMPISIKGTAEPGAQVRIVLEKRDEPSEYFPQKGRREESYRKIFDLDLLTDVDTGNFSFTLPSVEASFSTYNLKLGYKGYDYLIQDIYFGEVWLAAGESNMVMPVMYSDVKEDLHTLYNTRGLRFFLPNESGLLSTESEYSFTPRNIIPGAIWFDTSDRINMRTTH